MDPINPYFILTLYSISIDGIIYNLEIKTKQKNTHFSLRVGVSSEYSQSEQFHEITPTLLHLLILEDLLQDVQDRDLNTTVFFAQVIQEYPQEFPV